MTNILYLVDQCSTVRITMNNGALATVGQLQGKYQISDKINTKPSWVMAPYAIWWSLSFGWIIGTQAQIGQDFAIIYGGLNDGWKYYDGSVWIQAGEDDVSLDCITGKSFI